MNLKTIQRQLQTNQKWQRRVANAIQRQLKQYQTGQAVRNDAQLKMRLQRMQQLQCLAKQLRDQWQAELLTLQEARAKRQQVLMQWLLSHEVGFDAFDKTAVVAWLQTKAVVKQMRVHRQMMVDSLQDELVLNEDALMIGSKAPQPPVVIMSLATKQRIYGNQSDNHPIATQGDVENAAELASVFGQQDVNKEINQYLKAKTVAHDKAAREQKITDLQNEYEI